MSWITCDLRRLISAGRELVLRPLLPNNQPPIAIYVSKRHRPKQFRVEPEPEISLPNTDFFPPAAVAELVFDAQSSVYFGSDVLLRSKGLRCYLVFGSNCSLAYDHRVRFPVCFSLLYWTIDRLYWSTPVR